MKARSRSPPPVHAQVGPQEVPTWVAELEDTSGWATQGWQQLRPLLLETAFTGMNSTGPVLDHLGVSYTHVASADPKHHAIAFLKANNLLGQHHFLDIADLRPTATGAPRAPCALHGEACQPPHDRPPDLVVLGFPCQPWSTMRPGRHNSAPPIHHRLYDMTHSAIKYMLRAEPRLAILENTAGLAAPEGGTAELVERAQAACGYAAASKERTGLQLVRDSLETKFWVASCVLHMRPWVDMHRPRQWIFCVHRHLAPTTDLATAAAQVAMGITKRRSSIGPPRPWTEFVHRPGTELFRGDVLLQQAGALQGGQADAETAKWRTQATKMRERMRSGFPDWNATPDRQAAAGLCGIAPHQRALESRDAGHLRQRAESLGSQPRS